MFIVANSLITYYSDVANNYPGAENTPVSFWYVQVHHAHGTDCQPIAVNKLRSTVN